MTRAGLSIPSFGLKVKLVKGERNQIVGEQGNFNWCHHSHAFNNFDLCQFKKARFLTSFIARVFHELSLLYSQMLTQPVSSDPFLNRTSEINQGQYHQLIKSIKCPAFCMSTLRRDYLVNSTQVFSFILYHLWHNVNMAVLRLVDNVLNVLNKTNTGTWMKLHFCTLMIAC